MSKSKPVTEERMVNELRLAHDDSWNSWFRYCWRWLIDADMEKQNTVVGAVSSQQEGSWFETPQVQMWSR